MMPRSAARKGAAAASRAVAAWVTLCSAAWVVTAASLAAQAPPGNREANARTVWDGVFTVEQADRGRVQYAASCARCHGGSLEGGMGRSLVGTEFWTKWREQSVADLLTYVSANMPMGAPATALSASAYADIVAFVLRSNELPAGPGELTARSATDVRIVPKDGGSGELPATTLARIVGCLAPQEPDKSWRVTRATPPERVKSLDGPTSASADSGDRQYRLHFVLQPLAPLVGHRVGVVGILMGDGGADGINVSTVTSIAATCD